MTSSHSLQGALRIGGTVETLVATGGLTWDRQVFDDSGLIDEVSGPRPVEVE